MRWRRLAPHAFDERAATGAVRLTVFADRI